MLTIIMPFYKKINEIKFSFEHGNLEAFNSIENLELIIAVDDPCESQELLAYLNSLIEKKLIQFSIKVYLNKKAHEWRCPSSAINVGIINAYYEKCLVISPETITLKDSILNLYNLCNEKQYSCGIIKYSSPNDFSNNSLLNIIKNQASLILPYGSICFTKSQANKVCGYDESFLEWGGDDDDFRNRLVKAGFSFKQSLAKFLHIKFDSRIQNESKDIKTSRSLSVIQNKVHQIKNIKSYIANKGCYGKSFDDLVFCYQFTKFSKII